MGSYLCIASNGVPPSVSKRISLSIHCKYYLNYPFKIALTPFMDHKFIVRRTKKKIIYLLTFIIFLPFLHDLFWICERNWLKRSFTSLWQLIRHNMLQINHKNALCCVQVGKKNTFILMQLFAFIRFFWMNYIAFGNFFRKIADLREFICGFFDFFLGIEMFRFIYFESNVWGVFLKC
jgi:hypothetical protein